MKSDAASSRRDPDSKFDPPRISCVPALKSLHSLRLRPRARRAFSAEKATLVNAALLASGLLSNTQRSTGGTRNAVLDIGLSGRCDLRGSAWIRWNRGHGRRYRQGSIFHLSGDVRGRGSIRKSAYLAIVDPEPAAAIFDHRAAALEERVRRVHRHRAPSREKPRDHQRRALASFLAMHQHPPAHL